MRDTLVIYRHDLTIIELTIIQGDIREKGRAEEMVPSPRNTKVTPVKTGNGRNVWNPLLSMLRNENPGYCTYLYTTDYTG